MKSLLKGGLYTEVVSVTKYCSHFNLCDIILYGLFTEVVFIQSCL